MGDGGELDVLDLCGKNRVFYLGANHVGVIEIKHGIDLVKDLVGNAGGNKRKQGLQQLMCQGNIQGVFVEVEELVDLAKQASVVFFVFDFEENEKHVVGVVLRRARWLQPDGTCPKEVGASALFVMIPGFDQQSKQDAVYRDGVFDGQLFELVQRQGATKQVAGLDSGVIECGVWRAALVMLKDKAPNQPNQRHGPQKESAKDPVIEGGGEVVPLALEVGALVIRRENVGQHVNQFVSVAIAVFDFEIQARSGLVVVSQQGCFPSAFLGDGLLQHVVGEGGPFAAWQGYHGVMIGDVEGCFTGNPLVVLDNFGEDGVVKH